MPRRHNPYRLIAALRFGIAAGALAVLACAYLSRTNAANGILALLVKLQFSAALAKTGLAGIFVIAVLALTLAFGRLYCSFVCPLGTAQELCWRFGKFIRKRRGGKSPPCAAPSVARRGDTPLARQGYASAPKFRYVIALLVGAGFALSFSPLMMTFDPISNFGRFMGALRALAGTNAAFAALAIAVPPAVILAVAVFRGRWFCDWCPAGMTLGLFSRAAPFGMTVSARCVSCGACVKQCPVGCIEPPHIDRERCVLCFSCAASCPSKKRHPWRFFFPSFAEQNSQQCSSQASVPESAVSGTTRRDFLKNAGSFAAVCAAAYLLAPRVKLFARALPDAPDSEESESSLPILPPGAKNLAHYTARCVGCQACVSSCPVDIIKPDVFAHPVLAYKDAGCQFNCVECGKVCPTGAIQRMDVDEKHRTRLAVTSLDFEQCVVKTKLESCGACAEVCPTGALTMTAYEEGGIARLTRPVFDEQYCIGCGTCYAACPADPRALHIKAAREQILTAGPRPPEESGDELEALITDDFPF